MIDIRFHPKCPQFGFHKTKEHKGPFHMDLRSEWDDHFLMIHLIWFTIDLEWTTYP